MIWIKNIDIIKNNIDFFIPRKHLISFIKIILKEVNIENYYIIDVHKVEILEVL